MRKLTILWIISALLCLGLVNASGDSVLVNAPTDRVDGTGIDFNFTFRVSENVETVNCAAIVSSASTANSSSSVLFNISNATAANGQGLYVNFTLGAVDVIEDAPDYALVVTCYNSTTAFSNSSVSTLLVDRTAPSTPTSASPTGDVATGTQTFSATVTGTDTTSCTLDFDGTHPGSSSYTMSNSGDTCSLSLDVPDQLYKYTITATDGTNTSVTAQQSVAVGGTLSSGSGSGSGVSGSVSTTDTTATASGSVSVPSFGLGTKVWMGVFGAIIGLVIGLMLMPVLPVPFLGWIMAALGAWIGYSGVEKVWMVIRSWFGM